MRDQANRLTHEHRAVRSVSARTVSTFIPPRLRKTGVHELETCSCGMTRFVWITTFKVEAGAWSAPETGVTPSSGET